MKTKILKSYRRLKMVIKSARITKQPRSMPEGMSDPMPKVYVTLEDGKEEFLFEYYPDEISFTESDFIGLTIQEAIDLKRKKDMAYLQSSTFTPPFIDQRNFKWEGYKYFILFEPTRFVRHKLEECSNNYEECGKRIYEKAWIEAEQFAKKKL